MSDNAIETTKLSKYDRDIAAIDRLDLEVRVR